MIQNLKPTCLLILLLLFAFSAQSRAALAEDTQPDSPPPKTLQVQWYTLYVGGGTMTSGHGFGGGGMKLFRLNWEHFYFTVMNGKFLMGPSSMVWNASIEMGYRRAFGAYRNHVLYLGAELGFGVAFGNTGDSYIPHLAGGLFVVSPHLEYQYVFSPHLALTAELKISPPILKLDGYAVPIYVLTGVAF